MGDAGPRSIRFVTWVLVGLSIASSGFLVIQSILRHRAERIEADQRARLHAEEREAKLAPATSLQVWAAGARGSNGQFCSPCTFNPTMLYETSELADVRDFVSHFRFRRTVPDELEVANCGRITIDFLRDGKILHSANLKPVRLENESWSFVESWLRNHGDLLNKADSVLTIPRKNP
jgi:hypothetical protein